MKSLTTLTRTLTLSAGLLLASLAQALTIAPYSADALAKAQAAGQPVALHFHAGWCPTCRAQDKALQTLQAEPGLDLQILTVDYDKETALKRQLKVQTQSTFIVYKGAAEKARDAGHTGADELRALLKKAL